MLAEDLQYNLQLAGHEAELLQIPFKSYPPTSLVNTVMAARLLDVSEANGGCIDKVIGLKFPAWSVQHDNKSFWVLHQHRTAYELWGAEHSDIPNTAEGLRVKEIIEREDQRVLLGQSQVYTISQTVSDRLKYYSQVDSQVLYPPPRDGELYFSDSAKDYLFYPSRVTALKRQKLIVEALAHTEEAVKVVFAGNPDSEGYLNELKELASKMGVADRVTWLGYISDTEKRELYAQALAVIFTPIQEDYGYITPEAMLSSKPVIACSDSGAVLEFVENGINGFVSEPTAIELAKAMDSAWSDRKNLATMGEAAKETVEAKDLSWDKIIQSLL